MLVDKELDPKIIEKMSTIISGEVSLKMRPVEFVQIFQELLDTGIIFRLDKFWIEYHNFLWDSGYIHYPPFQKV